MLVICCMITTWMTEIVSNTATANIVLPILAQMAETVGINPLYLMVPAAATCCYTFVLPVGTPANAIVYNRGKMKPVDMVRDWFICIPIHFPYLTRISDHCRSKLEFLRS